MRYTEEVLLLAGQLHAALCSRPGMRNLDWLPYANYHGFEKWSLEADALEPLVAPYDFNVDLCQAEIIRVKKDLSNELHHHNQSDAAVIVLGPEWDFEPPRNASVFLMGLWRPLSVGATVLIRAGEIHGFRVEAGGILYFLSVQIPPIVGDHGDDYVKDS